MSTAAQEILRVLAGGQKTRRELLEALPGMSASAVDAALGKLRDSNTIEASSSTPGNPRAYWLPSPATTEPASDKALPGSAEPAPTSDEGPSAGDGALFALWSDGTFTAVQGEQRIDLDAAALRDLVRYLSTLGAGVQLDQ